MVTPPPTAAPIRTAKALLAAVEAAPSGSRSGTTAWDRTASPTLTQFVDEYYSKSRRKYATQRLRGQGLQGIAHRVWTTENSVYGDLALLQFADSSGSLSRFISIVEAYRADRTLTRVSFGGSGHAIAFFTKKLDSYGNTRGQGFAVVHNVMVELHTFNPGEWARADTQRWMTTQVARLS